MSFSKHALGTATLAIGNGATVSGTLTNRGATAFGLALPAAFTGVALTFKVSADNSTFQALYDTAGAQVSLTVAAGRSYQLPAALAAWPYWQIVSGSAEGGARTLVVTVQT